MGACGLWQHSGQGQAAPTSRDENPLAPDCAVLFQICYDVVNPLNENVLNVHFEVPCGCDSGFLLLLLLLLLLGFNFFYFLF